MEFSTEILDELKSISPLLAGIEKRNVFTAPEDYFDTLTIDIFKKINFNSIESGLTVPEGYFEGLSTSILHKIKNLPEHASTELRDLSPMLYSIQNENVFTVPPNYFKNLPDEILNGIQPQPQTKVVVMKKRQSIFRYAAAAVITAIIGVSSLLVFNKSQQVQVNQPETSSFYKQAVSQFKNEQQINQGISTLSDDEIIKYLDKNSSDADNDAITTNIEEKGMPDPKDYLQDEKTLDTYLDNIGTKNTQN